jgi:hypothetical protein
MSESIYPDILGMLARDRLALGGELHAAIGVFPNATALGQPVDVMLLLQSRIDQPLPLMISLEAPLRDDQGNLVNFFTSRPRVSLTLPPGECGLFHLPVTPELPTPPGTGYRVRVQIETNPPAGARQIRPSSGGPQPSLLAISPFRLAVLREIPFGGPAAGEDTLVAAFDVLAGRFPPQPDDPAPHYEPLWTTGDLQQEQARARAVSVEALSFARRLDRGAVEWGLRERTRLAFGGAGMPLHPGETLYVAKILAYVMADGLDLEPGFSLAGSHWFGRLCWLLANNPSVLDDTGELLRLVYTAAVQDAVMLGFHMVAHGAQADFGDQGEQAAYTDKVVAALEGRAPLALEHVYVPLVMAGMMVAPHVTVPGENPWHSLAQLEEARDGRIDLAGAAFGEVFDILNYLIDKTKTALHTLRIPPDDGQPGSGDQPH